MQSLVNYDLLVCFRSLEVLTYLGFDVPFTHHEFWAFHFIQCRTVRQSVDTSNCILERGISIMRIERAIVFIDNNIWLCYRLNLVESGKTSFFNIPL